jgi:hypothetical protein
MPRPPIGCLLPHTLLPMAMPQLPRESTSLHLNQMGAITKRLSGDGGKTEQRKLGRCIHSKQRCAEARIR